MTRLKYTSIDTQADWEEHLYHESVKVIGGFVETDNPLTIESLLYRGYEIVEEVVEAVIEEVAEVADAVVEIVEDAVDAIEEIAEDAADKIDEIVS